MMQQFLDSLAGKDSNPVDPMETLIPKESLGFRNYSPYYMGILSVGSFSLVVTLSEINPIFNRLVSGLYLGLIVLLAIDIINENKRNGYINKSRIYTYVGFYIVVSILLTFVIGIVSSI